MTRPGPVSNKTECSFLPVPPFPFPFRPAAAAVGGGSESTARPHHFHFELSPTGQEMAAVLRSATRRLAGHLPALERGHIQLPGASFDPLKGHCSAHSGFTSHCSPQTAALHGRAFRPARIAPSSNPVGSMCTRMFSTPAGGSARPPQDKTAALHGGAFRPARIAPSCNRVGSMRTRMFCTPAGGSARPPQDKFDICIRGGKMATLSNPNPKTYNMWVTGKNVADSHIEFWRFVRRVKNNDAVSEIKEQLRTEWQKVKLHPWHEKINRHYWLYFVYLCFVYVQVWCEIVGLKLPNNCEELGDAPADPFDLPCLFDEMF